MSNENTLPKTIILVIEDDDFLTDAYKIKLEQAGFRVKMAKDGESGLAFIKEQKPDLIILDLMLPRMDGFDVLAEIKKSEEYKDIPVVVASNFSDDSHKKQAAELGASDFFVKSDVSINDLVEHCQKLTS